ncbi:hypothetical protein [Kitasatospora cineracea]|uniref:hypothetical protein n=1 Tax=Kitasatospora cineracea TaxID=88074 RepID=UPI00368D47AD
MPKPQRIPWPPATGADAEHQKCRTCDRCTTGAGRDLDPQATDCWVDYLTAIAEHSRRSA